MTKWKKGLMNESMNYHLSLWETVVALAVVSVKPYPPNNNIIKTNSANYSFSEKTSI